MAFRGEVLNLYRRILRLANQWESALGNPGFTEAEKQYIRDEAKYLFRKNQKITDNEEIREHLKEGETRLELAQHYQNPYPRPVHLPQHVLHSSADKRLKAQTRKLKQSKPIYVKSYEDS